jgi:hypothetical protein
MDWPTGVPFPTGAGTFLPRHRVQTSSGAHPASYPMGTRGTSTGSKVAGAWSWPLTSIYCRGFEYVELCLQSRNTSSWRGAQWSTGTTLRLYAYKSRCYITCFTMDRHTVDTQSAHPHCHMYHPPSYPDIINVLKGLVSRSIRFSTILLS